MIVPVLTRQRPAAAVPRIRSRTVPLRPATASERAERRRVLLVVHALEEPHDLARRRAVRAAQARAVDDPRVNAEARERRARRRAGAGRAPAAERRPERLEQHLGEQVVRRDDVQPRERAIGGELIVASSTAASSGARPCACGPATLTPRARRQRTKRRAAYAAGSRWSRGRAGARRGGRRGRSRGAKPVRGGAAAAVEAAVVAATPPVDALDAAVRDGRGERRRGGRRSASGSPPREPDVAGDLPPARAGVGDARGSSSSRSARSAAAPSR